MPFGLKNAEATYQRLVTKMFKDQFDKTMNVYIDDMLVKSVKAEDHIDHLKEAFDILRWYEMKLNLEKCAFGVASGKFLGFLVSQWGIEVNPDQIKAIEGIPGQLTTKKEVQSLTALGELKSYRSSPPLLSKPEPGEHLLVYLDASKVAVSALLIRESKDRDLQAAAQVRRMPARPDPACLERRSGRPRQISRSHQSIITGDKSVVHLLNSSPDQIEVNISTQSPLRSCSSSGEWISSVHPNTRIRGNHLHMEKNHLPIQLIQEISYDNEPQFMKKKTAEFFEKWHIKRILSIPYHPTGNGKAESSNKFILNIMKKKLEDVKRPWPELLPEVLWAYRTTPKTSTGETTYSLVKGTEAVIPVEVGEPSLRYSH
ncbi:PREDICTED: uncharacterized protein LOC109239371 [Nicotiana attenuata]|uniref:uncharacterized protein LOC109239371 n=1 Tax=Nicotiana attenuata TaxID=49451 RepID=UPI000904C4FC|nr:PREDICTED: uncharacterized protein LOC109239371 [Nicotiana attenuata]